MTTLNVLRPYVEIIYDPIIEQSHVKATLLANIIVIKTTRVRCVS